MAAGYFWLGENNVFCEPDEDDGALLCMDFVHDHGTPGWSEAMYLVRRLTHLNHIATYEEFWSIVEEVGKEYRQLRAQFEIKEGVENVANYMSLTTSIYDLLTCYAPHLCMGDVLLTIAAYGHGHFLRFVDIFQLSAATIESACTTALENGSVTMALRIACWQVAPGAHSITGLLQGILRKYDHEAVQELLLAHPWVPHGATIYELQWYLSEIPIQDPLQTLTSLLRAGATQDMIRIHLLPALRANQLSLGEMLLLLHAGFGAHAIRYHISPILREIGSGPILAFHALRVHACDMRVHLSKLLNEPVLSYDDIVILVQAGVELYDIRYNLVPAMSQHNLLLADIRTLLSIGANAYDIYYSLAPSVARVGIHTVCALLVAGIDSYYIRKYCARLA